MQLKSLKESSVSQNMTKVVQVHFEENISFRKCTIGLAQSRTALLHCPAITD